MTQKNTGRSFSIFVLSFLLSTCGISKRPPAKDIANTPEELKQKATDNIRTSLEYALDNKGDLGDSVILFNSKLVQAIYERNQNTRVWSEAEKWKPMGDSLLHFIASSKLYGLFPEDYYHPILDSINRLFLADSLSISDRRDAALWSKADMLLTDAFFHIVKDVKLGRLPNDSITLRKDSVLKDEFYLAAFDKLQSGTTLYSIISSLEPSAIDYHLLKAGIQRFLDSADYREFTSVPAPGKNNPDFKRLLQQRLFEGGFIAFDSVLADSVQLAAAVKQFQKKQNLKIDGKAGEGTVRMMNTNDKDKFVSIAITLDRYKMLAAKMPEKYIWVNLPSFYMKLQVGDTVKLVSKVVCGKPLTRTPVLTSAISEIIIYPQWTVPASIIVKEILPAVKKNPGYLARKGFSLIDGKGDEVDPYSVDWSKYSKGIPYRVVQGSGDANALGVIKFNFPNKYAVYLHDTNQRYLFGQTTRSLSHGCVRVQEWQKLADFIIRNDLPAVDGKIPMIDSMASWLKKKEKHSIAIKKKVPVFIRYMTCEGRSGAIVFYDDIYGEDKRLRESYFQGK